MKIINAFYINASFLYPPENFRKLEFFDVFREYRQEVLAWYGLKCLANFLSRKICCRRFVCECVCVCVFVCVCVCVYVCVCKLFYFIKFHRIRSKNFFKQAGWSGTKSRQKSLSVISKKSSIGPNGQFWPVVPQNYISLYLRIGSKDFSKFSSITWHNK